MLSSMAAAALGENSRRNLAAKHQMKLISVAS
jgi:hypothetical protein